MAPKRPAAAAAAASGSASDASDAEADAPHHPRSDTDPSKTPPPNPNPKSSASAAAAAAAAPSAPADSAPARSDSGGSYSNSDAAARRPRPAAPAPKQPRPRSPGINSDSYDSHAAAGFDTDLDPAADSDSDSANHTLTPPPRPARHHNPRAEAAIVKPISSRPMDPQPRRGGGAKRPRSAAVPAPAPPPSSEKRPARLWSPDDELVILRGLATYRAKSGVLPGSTNDIGKLHGHIRAQLSVKVSTTQLSDKVRRLKQKYQLLATRAKNGRDQELHTPHDRSIYDHAKKVWGTRTTASDDYDIAAGDGGDSEDLPASGDSDDNDDDMDSGRDDRYRIKNRKLMPIAMANGHSIRRGPSSLPPPNGRTKTEFEKGKDSYPYLWETVEELAREHPSGAAFKKAFEVLEGSKAQVMEEKLRKFRLTEIRQQLRRMDLMKDTVRMVLDALERAD